MDIWTEKVNKWLEVVNIYQTTLSELLDNEACFYCGSQAESFDHVLARAKGGQDTPDNLVPVCRNCNQSKSDKSLVEWLDSQLSRRDIAQRQVIPDLLYLMMVHARIATLETLIPQEELFDLWEQRAIKEQAIRDERKVHVYRTIRENPYISAKELRAIVKYPDMAEIVQDLLFERKVQNMSKHNKHAYVTS